jgi:DNA polymerase-4
VRTGDFATATRAVTLRDPTDLADTLIDAARTLYRERIELHGKGVRLLGVGVSGLVSARSAPSSLFTDPQLKRARKLAEAQDAVNDKLGDDVVTRASLLKRKSHEASSLPTVD